MAKAAEKERQKAEEAMRIASEKAKFDAERKAAQPAPQIDRSPLPPANDMSAPVDPAPKPKLTSVLDRQFSEVVGRRIT